LWQPVLDSALGDGVSEEYDLAPPPQKVALERRFAKP
jgi:hypothetical protein